MSVAEIKEVIENSEEYTKQWKSPDKSIVMQELKPAPEFPLELLHPEWADFIKIAAECKNAPVDFVVAGVFSTISGLVGGARWASPWDGWTEPTILWQMLVGDPSVKKSPALDVMFDVVRQKEDELAVEYKRILKNFKFDVEVANAKMDEWKNNLKKSIKHDNQINSIPEDAISPEQPPRPRMLLNDSTIEKIAILLGCSNKGLTLFRDELSGLIANLERRGGSDREFYLESYGGRSYAVDRVKNPEPIIVSTLALSIIGGMQPDKLEKFIINSYDDGFSARFLYCYPEKLPFKRPENFYNDCIVKQAIDKLYNIQSDIVDGKFNKHIIKFTNDAAKIQEEWCSEQNSVHNNGGLLSSFNGKMAGTIVRLSSVTTYMDWAISDDVVEPDKIEYETVLKAIGIVDSYYIPMAERTLCNCALPQDHKDAKTIALWLLNNKQDVINLSNITREKGSPLRDRKRLQAVFELLTEAGWICHIGGRDDDRNGGRERQDYTVNPLIYKECLK